MTPRDLYENPLITRYASTQMGHIWSAERKFRTWRQLWVALAEAQMELGLPISPEQVQQLRQHVDDIDFEAAGRYERKLRHDVMAHVHAYGDACPAARPIIHLGATSCFVTDNTDLILLREALKIVRGRLVAVVDALAQFAERYRDLACLGLTHLQPAQPTTVGKRACLWAYDLVIDLADVEHRLDTLLARSTKGTTGTQASFLKLFNGDHDKVRSLEERITQKMGFPASYPVTGQTYSRKVDAQFVDALSSVAQSAHKAATDLRLLANRREIEEPLAADQVGSSAMAYKRNPMRCERICGLARFAIGLQTSAAATAATQWMERTLDDSAIRRLILPQAFLAVDAVLILYQNVASGLVVYPEVIAANLSQEAPFLGTENILMAAVQAGGDRQDLHQRIQTHSRAAAARIKQEGRPNDLIARLTADEAFAGVDLQVAVESSRLVGRAPQQVDEFLASIVAPLREKYAANLGDTEADVTV